MKYLNYFLIILGAIIATYGKSENEQNQFVLIGGIIVLMIGVYRVSRKVPSRQDKESNLDNSEEEE